MRKAWVWILVRVLHFALDHLKPGTYNLRGNFRIVIGE